jgi:hypothetical protein
VLLLPELERHRARLLRCLSGAPSLPDCSPPQRARSTTLRRLSKVDLRYMRASPMHSPTRVVTVTVERIDRGSQAHYRAAYKYLLSCSIDFRCSDHGDARPNPA